MDIGQRIRGLRAAQGITQTALGRTLGLKQSHISEIETSGDKSQGMSARQIERFAAGLNVRPAALIDQQEYLKALQQFAVPAGPA